jgi:beta-lactamase class A
MKTFVQLLVSLAAIFIQSSCTDHQEETTRTNEIGIPANHDFSDLRHKIDSISKSVAGRIGVAVINLSTGDSFSFNGHAQFAMFSTYKFPLALYALHLVEQGKLKLNQTVTIKKKDFSLYKHGKFIETHQAADISVTVDSMIYYAMSYSDNITTDQLFHLVGGPSKVNDFIRQQGVKEIAIANTVKEMNTGDLYKHNWTHPMGMTQLLQLFQQGKVVNNTHRAYLLRYMETAPSGAKRIKALLPEGTVVAHKTGTGGVTDDGIIGGCNDVGIITIPNSHQLAISIYLNDLRGDIPAAENIIAEIAKAIYDAAVDN